MRIKTVDNGQIPSEMEEDSAGDQGSQRTVVLRRRIG
jgi:hypothetical protein